MIFAILTSAWVIFFLYAMFVEKDGELAAIVGLMGGFVWGLVCMLLLPYAAVQYVETERYTIDNDSIVRYDVVDTDVDVITFEDANGIMHAIDEGDFENASPEAAVATECAEPIWWSSPFAWEECDTVVYGNIN